MKKYSLLQFANLFLILLFSSCDYPTLDNQVFAAYRYEEELSTKDTFFTRHVFVIQQSFIGKSRIYKIYIDREFAGEFWFEGMAHYPEPKLYFDGTRQYSEPQLYEANLYYKDKDSYVFGKFAGSVQVDVMQPERIVGGRLLLLGKVYSLKKYPEPFIIVH